VGVGIALVTAVVAVSVWLGPCGRKAGPSTCLSIECAKVALRHTLHHDWDRLDENAFERLWPGVIAADERQEQIASVLDAIRERPFVGWRGDVCCALNEVCVLPVLEDDGSGERLYRVAVGVCPGREEAWLDIVEAAVPADARALHADWGPRSSRVGEVSRRAFRWKRAGVEIGMEASLVEGVVWRPGETWGQIVAQRCFTPFGPREWVEEGDAGGPKYALDKLPSQTGRSRSYHMSHYTQCDTEGPACVDQEVAALWQRAQGRAERVGADRLEFDVWGCLDLDRRSAFRRPDGSWDTSELRKPDSKGAE